MKCATLLLTKITLTEKKGWEGRSVKMRSQGRGSRNLAVGSKEGGLDLEPGDLGPPQHCPSQPRVLEGSLSSLSY